MNAWARRGRTSASAPTRGMGEPQRRIADGSWGACLARVWARIRGCAKTTNNHELGEERFIKKCSTLLDSIRLTQGKLLCNIYSN